MPLKLYREVETTPVARLALNANLAVHELHQTPADRQPEPRAAIAPGRGTVGLTKSVENHPLLRGQHSDARIGNAEPQHRTIGLKFLQPHVHFDKSPRRELDRVVNQIQQDLAKP